MKEKDKASDVATAISAALELILLVPGYRSFGEELTVLHKAGRLRYDATLPDRAVTGRLGQSITIGPEAMQGGTVSLSQTLVHEQFHRTQSLFAKPLSLWSGVFTHTPVWRRLELPAYRAAYDFLIALEKYARENNQPEWAISAQQEQAAISHVFYTYYGIPLIS